jgi:hypothetical protein
VNETAGRRVATLIVSAVVLVIVLNILAHALDDAVGGREPGGDGGSSYATQQAGLAADTQLLSDYGHPIRRLRGSVAGARFDTGDNVVVVSPSVSFSETEGAVLRDVARQGGRVVLAGVPTAEVARVVDEPTQLERVGAKRYRTFAPRLSALHEVDAAGSASYALGSEEGVLARSGESVLAKRYPVGAGEVVTIADPSVLTNKYLGTADNAAFALLVTGDDEHRVVFAEGVHGYGEATGLAAIPTRWRYALVLLAGALVVYAWARGRRLGPPDRPQRALGPARADYVDALSSTLARSRDATASLGSLATWARETAARRTGLPADAPRERIEDAARALGLPDDEVAALWREPRTDADTMALGRAIARVSDGRISP